MVTEFVFSGALGAETILFIRAPSNCLSPLGWRGEFGSNVNRAASFFGSFSTTHSLRGAAGGEVSSRDGSSRMTSSAEARMLSR